LPAFLHARHRLGEARKYAVYRERLRAAMALARVEHGAIVGSQDIIQHRRVSMADGLAGATLDGSELQAAFADGGAKRSGADPGEADPGGND